MQSALSGRPGLLFTLLPGLLFTLLLAGCSACDGDRAVPFKREEARRGSHVSAPKTVAADRTEAEEAAEGTPLRQGTSYPEGTTQIELGGRALALSQDSAVRAALDVDLDADGQAELLLVTQDAAGRPALQVARPEGRGWAPPEGAQDLLEGEACTLREAHLALLDKTFAAAEAVLDCSLPASEAAEPTGGAPRPDPGAGPVDPLLPPPEPPAPPGTPGADGPTRAERQIWVIALERTPRLVERIASALPAGDASAPHVEPAVRSRDLDGDAHSDLELALAVHAGEQTAADITLHLLSRAGGLALDAGEPEPTLLALADQAKGERKRNPARALELARRVLALHGALCAESGRALLRLGDTRGLPCGASLAAGRAASIETAVLASQGRVLEAMAVYETLDGPAYRLTENDWERARYALSARSDSQAFEFRKGPRIAVPAAPPARRPVIAFLDERRLLVRTQPPASYDLEQGTLTPIGMPGSLLHTDPSGRYAIAAVVRSCQGYHLQVVEAARIVAGVVAGPSVSEPLVMKAPPPPGAHCPELSRSQRKDDGGLRVLAWTTQGVLLSRGPELLLLALDGSARASAEARALAGSAAITGLPPHQSEITPDGRSLALLTPLGLALHDRRKQTTRLVTLPEGANNVTDLALSPSGQRIALVQGGRLVVGAPRAQTATTAVAPKAPGGARVPEP